MLIEIPSTDLGIIPLGVTSQWHLLEFVICAPCREITLQSTVVTVKVMNITYKHEKKTPVIRVCENSTVV